MRVTRWTLLAAALAVSVCAKDAEPEAAECLAPAAVAALESKVGELRQSNAALQLQVDSQAADKTRLLADVAQEHEAIVLKLQGEIAALTKDVEALEKDVGSQKEAVDKTQAELKAALDKLNAETKRADSRDGDVAKLEQDLVQERSAVTETQAELKAALAKLADESKRSSALDKSLQALEKKNRALSKELSETTSVELTMASLLSSYYDDALVLAEQALAAAQQKLDEQSGALEHVQGKIEDAKKTACATSSKFYKDNLAATLDPILVDVRKTVDPIVADVHKAVNPHLEKYLPIVQKEAAKAKEQVVAYSQEALRRAKLARVEAITLLEQNEHVATHAQKVVDGVLIILAVPLVLFQIRLALRLVWWLFTAMVCVLTCGMCCGSRKRCSKTKRKGVKKTTSANASLNAPLNGPTKKATSSGKTTTTTQKRNKKGKN
ncbi:transport protein sec1 protein [Phytophthora cinnamomi]|uniref:transport protein sec1 protein n=1 Tax=Phytophthora cinnamomi TaxID=4785 RepID=UPI00355A07B4|nr:transport protein sec1 protein [Phytophthora cinnamomi]